MQTLVDYAAVNIFNALIFDGLHRQWTEETFIDLELSNLLTYMAFLNGIKHSFVDSLNGRKQNFG